MKLYTVEIGGVEHTLQLTDEEQQERYPDAKPVQGGKSETASDKSRSARDK